jgi:hypothetical protein
LAHVAVELVDRVAILVAVHRCPRMGAADSRSLRYDIYVRMQRFVRRTTHVPFRRILGDVRREFMLRLFDAFHGTLGSYLRDALQEGICYGMPSCSSGLGFSPFPLFVWWSQLLFLVRFFKIRGGFVHVILSKIGPHRQFLPC